MEARYRQWSKFVVRTVAIQPLSIIRANASYPRLGLTPRLVMFSKNSRRSLPIPRRLSMATGYWSASPTPSRNQDCCSNQGRQSELTTLGSSGDRAFSLHQAHFAARFTVSPASGTPDLMDAPAPSSSTGWRCSIKSARSLPGSTRLISAASSPSIYRLRVGFGAVFGFCAGEQSQNFSIRKLVIRKANASVLLRRCQ